MKQTNIEKLNELLGKLDNEGLKNLHEYVLLKLRIKEMEQAVGMHD